MPIYLCVDKELTYVGGEKHHFFFICQGFGELEGRHVLYQFLFILLPF